MKIRDLIKQTGVPRQTIHYYIQNGLLPKPRKTGRNSAEYTERHVELIRLIRRLQDEYFLPLSVIKKILKKYGGTPEKQALLRFQQEFFRPVEQLLAGAVKGEAAFLKTTGLNPERLADYESWGIITPDDQDGEKLYSYDDQVIGRIIAQWRNIGLTSERGFPPNIIRELHDRFLNIVLLGNRYYLETALNTMTHEEILEQQNLALETTAMFFYRLYRKLARREYEGMVSDLAALSDKNDPPDGPEN